MIRLDCTKSSVVVICSDCPHWSAMAFTRLGGLERAAAHEKLVHPGEKHAQWALATYRKRARHAG